MTVNLIRGPQAGASLPVIAYLHLPSLWTHDQVDVLQRSLAKALAEGLGVPLAQVQVVTTIVQSGHVVEDGDTRDW